MQTFKSNGKLLLTGEYVVLDGALSLALPTCLGQSLNVTPTDEKGVFWKSFTVEKELWFDEKLFTQSENPIAKTLEKILEEARRLNPDFLSQNIGFQVETYLDFPLNWGLGSSSTLINNIARWAEVNPFKLLFNSFAGSGYDIACAKAESPLLYQINDSEPKSYPVNFCPEFHDKFFFIHLNKKQNSREGIARYQQFKKSKTKIISEITSITEQLVQNPSFTDFCELLDSHETIISQCISLAKVKELLFSDFQGCIKSLGAWGGDFILACGEKEYVFNYFISKGFGTIFSFDELILNPTTKNI